jgi:hypothetical protein
MLCTRIGTPCVLLLALLIFASRAAGAEDTVSADPVVAKLHDRVVRFLESVSTETNTAFNDLLLGSPLSEQKESVRSLVDKSKEIADRYGAFRESEQVSAKRIGKDVVLLKYLYKCEKFPVLWYFAFYRDFTRSTVAGDDYWLVISVRFDTQIEALGY